MGTGRTCPVGRRPTEKHCQWQATAYQLLALLCCQPQKSGGLLSWSPLSPRLRLPVQPPRGLAGAALQFKPGRCTTSYMLKCGEGSWWRAELLPCHPNVRKIFLPGHGHGDRTDLRNVFGGVICSPLEQWCLILFWFLVWMSLPRQINSFFWHCKSVTDSAKEPWKIAQHRSTSDQIQAGVDCLQQPVAIWALPTCFHWEGDCPQITN